LRREPWDQENIALSGEDRFRHRRRRASASGEIPEDLLALMDEAAKTVGRKFGFERHEDLEDLRQELALQYAKSPDRWAAKTRNGASGRFLHTVARRVCIWLRYRRRNSKLRLSQRPDFDELSAKTESAEEQLLLEEMWAWVESACSSEEDGQIVKMRYEGYELAEIAKALGKTYGATRQQVDRIRKRFRDLYPELKQQ
jgi:RNA polymerase sigma factor (sigma-70 family)